MIWPFSLLCKKKKKVVAPKISAPIIPIEDPVITPVVNPLPEILMGVSIFCGWASERDEFEAVPGIQCVARYPWKTLATDDRHMALGEYDERLPAITEQYIKWMQEGGIGVASVQIDWAHEHTSPGKLPRWRKRIATPLLMGHVAENWPADANVKYYLSNWDVMAGDPIWNEMKDDRWNAADVEDSWRQLGKVIARHADKLSYFRIDNRPVFQFGWAHNLPFYERAFGVTPKRITEILREEAGNLYIVSTCTEETTWPLTKEWGWDAVTQYALLGNGWTEAASNHRLWWNKGITFAKTSGMDFWVPISCGYDSTAWGSPEKVICMPTMPEYIAHIKEARKFARDNYQYTKGIVHKYAGNEIGEGGIFFPMADVPGNLHRGAEVMDAFKIACTEI